MRTPVATAVTKTAPNRGLLRLRLHAETGRETSRPKRTVSQKTPRTRSTIPLTMRARYVGLDSQTKAVCSSRMEAASPRRFMHCDGLQSNNVGTVSMHVRAQIVAIFLV